MQLKGSIHHCTKFKVRSQLASTSGFSEIRETGIYLTPILCINVSVAKETMLRFDVNVDALSVRTSLYN